MIVECGSCGTRFQLDDARIPDSGIRVRCSKCKQAFFLPHPEAADPESPSQEPVTASPDETRDLRADSLDSAAVNSLVEPPAAGDAAASGAADAIARGNSTEDEEEADWQFNNDAPSDTFEDTDESLIGGLLPDESGAGIELADDNDSTGSQFEPLGESIGLSDDVEPEVLPSEEDAVLAALGADESPQGEEEVEDATPDLDEPASDAIFAEDLGSPEEWDFLSDDPVPASASAAAPGAGATSGHVDVGPTSELAEPVARPVAMESVSSGRREMHVVANTIGWALCLLLLAAGTARGLLPGKVFSTPEQVPVPLVAVGNLEAEGGEGRWLDTAGHGRVFVVSGELRNRTQSVSAAEAGLRIVVYDEKGDRLQVEPSLAGVGLSKDEIREASVSALNGAEAAAHVAFAHAAVAPGASLPFYAVLRELPLEASRIGFEVTDAPSPPHAEVAAEPGHDLAIAADKPEMAVPSEPAAEIEPELDVVVEAPAALIPESPGMREDAVGSETPAAIAP